MSIPRKVIVVKIPREDPIIDKPISFSPFKNLHLELIENKKKLKKHIPAVSVRKKEAAAPAPPPPESVEEEGDVEEEDALAEFEVAAASGGAVSALVASVENKSASQILASADDDDADVGDDVEEVGNDVEVDLGDDVDADVGIADDEDAEKKEQEEKEEYIHKWSILAKKFPNRKDFPTYTEHDDLETMKKSYNRVIKEVNLDNRVSIYRKILSYSFLAIEILAKYMKIDMTDFAAYQNQSLGDYDSLLVELGEKNEGSIFDSIPVEVKLFGMIFFNTVAFWFMKNKNIDLNKFYNLAATKLGSMTASSEDHHDEEVEKPKKKMKGPSLKKN
jgi:hypothetical protein